MFDRSEEKTFDWGVVSLAMIVILFLFLLGYAIWKTERIDASSDKSVKAMMERPNRAGIGASRLTGLVGGPGGSIAFSPIERSHCFGWFGLGGIPAPISI